MSMKSKFLRPLALGAFAVALLSAPFITSAKADWDDRNGRYERSVEKQEYREKDHRRMHKAEKRHRHYEEGRHQSHDRIRKHRRIRHAWKHKHHDRKQPTKVVYKVVEVQPAPEPRYDHQERLIRSLIEAVFAANVAPRYR